MGDHVRSGVAIQSGAKPSLIVTVIGKLLELFP